MNIAGGSGANDILWSAVDTRITIEDLSVVRLVGNIPNKTIVFTAAFLPEAFKDSDADFNVGMAVGTVMSLENGTFIAMNGMLLNPEKCKKNNQTGKFEKIHE